MQTIIERQIEKDMLAYEEYMLKERLKPKELQNIIHYSFEDIFGYSFVCNADGSCDIIGKRYKHNFLDVESLLFFDELVDDNCNQVEQNNNKNKE